ncbi:MAG: ECF transporter S component [Clostridia bacterium]|nr:ECF transporter S component [Clostridia bacterium]
MKNNVKKLTFSALCLALCMVLPFLTGQIQQIGNALCPMHIPVLLCGFICGWQYGLVVGLIAPVLRFAIFSMPPLLPIGIAMSFELAAYGAFAGLLYKKFPRRAGFIYPALALSMLIGRLVWGCARYVISLFYGGEFTLPMFIAGGFTTAIPGIICHILLIPIIVLALRRAGLALND